MSNPAFIVDGQMEKKIIQSLCPSSPVRILNRNGKDVSYDVAGKYASSLIRLLKHNYPIIIVFDRENRSDPSATIATSLHDAIIGYGIQNVDILIGVPDRMIENWLLADISSINMYYGLNPCICQINFEGTNGKSKLRSIIGNSTYSETQDGPAMFSLCSVNNLYSNSSSFKSFCNIIKTINCTWLSEFNLKMPS
jgi:hypothetical protein